MKKFLAILLLIICTSLSIGSVFAQGNPASNISDPNAPAPTPETDIRKPVRQIPLPFSPPETSTNDGDVGQDFIRQEIEASSGIEGEIRHVSIANQEVPIFQIAQTGMRFVISGLFFIAGPITLIMIVYSGIMLVVKAENEEESAKTRRTLIFSAIGLLIIAFAYAIVQNVIKIF